MTQKCLAGHRLRFGADLRRRLRLETARLPPRHLPQQQRAQSQPRRVMPLVACWSSGHTSNTGLAAGWLRLRHHHSGRALASNCHLLTCMFCHTTWNTPTTSSLHSRTRYSPTTRIVNRCSLPIASGLTTICNYHMAAAATAATYSTAITSTEIFCHVKMGLRAPLALNFSGIDARISPIDAKAAIQSVCGPLEYFRAFPSATNHKCTMICCFH